MVNTKQLDAIKETSLKINGRNYLIKKPRVINGKVNMAFRMEGSSIESLAVLDISNFDGSQDNWDAICIRKLLDIFNSKADR